MASLRSGLRRKPKKSTCSVGVSHLKKENVYLRASLDEMSRQYSENKKIIEKFVTLQINGLQYFQQLQAKDNMIVLLLEQLSEKKGIQADSKQLLEYDQPSELWPEKQQQQHNDAHSDGEASENKEESQKEDHNEQKVLKEQAAIKQSGMQLNQWWDEMMNQMKAFKEQMQVEEMSRQSATAYQQGLQERSRSISNNLQAAIRWLMSGLHPQLIRHK
ncbi:uncharacterized protein DDB_G0290301-like [Brachionichthys hirsutus]|uniref:uncharacterized protein DDB_G0290301-like n=1 Tax=Brachionichthys hirsutus TaxID=412623 RepID=UPI0036052C58